MKNINFDINNIINEINNDINNINKNNNLDNISDYSNRSNPDYRRSDDADKIAQQIRDTDWQQESKYHNYYRRNGKSNVGNTITCKNTDYLKRIKDAK